MYRTIIWATDGSESADGAFTEVRRLALLSGARVLAVHCDQRLTGGRAGGLSVLIDEPEIREKLETAIESLRVDGIEAELLVESTRRSPARFVASVAEETQADMIVCGSRALGALSGAFLGSFTHALLPIAPCPVLAVGLRGRTVDVVDEMAVGTPA